MRAAFAQSPDAEIHLENQLKLSLQPVQPSPEFVGHLHRRLTTPAQMTIERRQNAAFGLLLLAFSLLSGVFLFLLLRQFRAA
jgi:hypothetical protein